MVTGVTTSEPPNTTRNGKSGPPSAVARAARQRRGGSVGAGGSLGQWGADGGQIALQRVGALSVAGPQQQVELALHGARRPVVPAEPQLAGREMVERLGVVRHLPHDLAIELLGFGGAAVAEAQHRQP